MSRWIYIPGNVPSLKNGKDIIQIAIKGARPCPVCKKRKSRPMLTASKTHKAYTKSTSYLWKAQAAAFRGIAAKHEGRLSVCLYFVRDSRRIWDFTNATDTVQDLMVEHGWIEDDNVKFMAPFFSGYHVDKAEAGVYITVHPVSVPKPPTPKAQEDLFYIA